MIASPLVEQARVLATSLPAHGSGLSCIESNVTGIVQEALRDSYAQVGQSLLERAERVTFVSALKRSTRALLDDAQRARASWADAAQGDVQGYRAPEPLLYQRVDPETGVIYTPLVSDTPAEPDSSAAGIGDHRNLPTGGGRKRHVPQPPAPAPRPVPAPPPPRNVTTLEVPRTVSTIAGLDAYLGELEQDLSTLGEDSQLASVALQAELQRQTETLQLLSNVSKILHDTALAVVRKAGA